MLTPEYMQANTDRIVQALEDGTLPPTQVSRALKKNQAYILKQSGDTIRLLVCTLECLARHCDANDMIDFVRSVPNFMDPQAPGDTLEMLMLRNATRNHPDEEVVLQLCGLVPSVLLKSSQNYNVERAGCRKSLRMTYMAYAALHGRQRVVQMLFEVHGVKPDSVGDGCARPISLAASNGQTRVVEYLYDLMQTLGWKEKDILNKSSCCRPLLEDAVNSDCPEVLAAVVERAYRVDPTGWFRASKTLKYGEDATILHVAVGGCPKNLRWLLMEWPMTFDVNAMATYGTLLHYACVGNDADVVECLVEFGASVHILDHYGRLPSDVAYSKKHDALAAYLRRVEKIRGKNTGVFMFPRRTMEAALSEELRIKEQVAADDFDRRKQDADALAEELLRLEMEEENKLAAKQEKKRQRKASKKKKTKGTTACENPHAEKELPEAPSSEAVSIGKTLEEEGPPLSPPRLAQQDIPPILCCPIGYEMFEDPVSASDGQVYERAEIEGWIDKHGGSAPSPFNANVVLTKECLCPSYIIKQMVEDWKAGKMTMKA